MHIVEVSSSDSAPASTGGWQIRVVVEAERAWKQLDATRPLATQRGPSSLAVKTSAGGGTKEGIALGVNVRRLRIIVTKN